MNSTNARRRKHGGNPLYRLAAWLLRYGVGMACGVALLWSVALFGTWGWLSLVPIGLLGGKAALWVQDDY